MSVKLSCILPFSIWSHPSSVWLFHSNFVVGALIGHWHPPISHCHSPVCIDVLIAGAILLSCMNFCIIFYSTALLFCMSLCGHFTIFLFSSSSCSHRGQMCLHLISFLFTLLPVGSQLCIYLVTMNTSSSLILDSALACAFQSTSHTFYLLHRYCPHIFFQDFPLYCRCLFLLGVC